MNITSLLQEAPSVDRTRRNKPQWDEALTGPASTPGLSSKPGLDDSSNSAGLGMGGQSRSFQVMNEYIHPSHRDREREREREWDSGLGYKPHTYEKEKEKEKEISGSTSAHQVDYGAYKRDYLKQPDYGLAQEDQQVSRPASSMDTARPFDLTLHPHPHSHSPLVKPAIVSSIAPIKEPIPIPASVPAPVPVPTTLLPPPRTPSPSLDAVHLGNYVYPNLPFPIYPSSLPYNRRTTLTALIPSTLLPRPSSSIHSDPRARNIWGGIPHVDQRKLYTDDSDLLFAALHAGVIPYDEKLFAKGRDLKLELRLYPFSEYGRFFGGLGENGLTSASWGNSHEGCAFAILSAKWVTPHTAHSYTRQTRKARMAEYAQRRAAVMNSSLPSTSSQEENLIPPSILDAFKLSPPRPEVDPIEQEITSLTLSGDWQHPIGFKYAPVSLYLILFAFSPNERTQTMQEAGAPPAKRRKLDTTDKEIILRTGTKPNDRIVLVPKATNNGVMETDGQTSQLMYDMFRETPLSRASESGLKDPSTNVNSGAVKEKGVRFVQPELKEEWKRELVFEDVGMLDIAFEEHGVKVRDVLFEVKEWTWYSTSPGNDLKGGIVRTKRVSNVSAKKRKAKRRGKGKKAAAVSTAVVEMVESSAHAEETTKAEPVPAASDKEEGELSG